VGAIGEKVVAKYKNIYWTKGEMRDSDVGVYQVRATVEHNNRLILHPYDDDDDVFYFVTGHGSQYRIQGWIKASEGKHQEYWQDPTRQGRHAFFVPTSKLNGMN